MISYNFQIRKIVQIVNFLLKLNNYRLNYTKLIKLLYLADRESLNRWDETISNDKYVNMKNGPVLSKVYDLIKGCNFRDNIQILWDSYFFKDNYDLVSHIKDDLSTDELSDREKELLQEIDGQYKSYRYGRMIDIAHELPEWKENNPGDSSIPLYVNEILKKLGRTDDEIRDIEDDHNTYLVEEQFFNECT
jgi:uncharacterized phage-associated protein